MLPCQKPNQPNLSDQLRAAIRLRDYSYRTEESYGNWIKRYTLCAFHHKRHPRDMGAPEMEIYQNRSCTKRDSFPARYKTIPVYQNRSYIEYKTSRTRFKRFRIE